MAKPRVAGTYGRRRYKKGTKASKAAKGRRRIRTNKGGFHISRKVPPITIKTGASNGTIVAHTPTGFDSSLLTFGTPVSSNTGFTNVYDIPFAMTFKLDQVVAATEIRAISDKYKILNVKMKLHGFNQNMSSSGSYVPMVYIEYVSDFDDDTVPTPAEFDERMGIRVKSFNQQGMINFSIRPKVGLVAIGSYHTIPARQMFVDCAAPACPHYGLKGIIRNVLLNTTAGYAFILQPTFSIVAKDLQ